MSDATSTVSATTPPIPETASRMADRCFEPGIAPQEAFARLERTRNFIETHGIPLHEIRMASDPTPRPSMKAEIERLQARAAQDAADIARNIETMRELEDLSETQKSEIRRLQERITDLEWQIADAPPASKASTADTDGSKSENDRLRRVVAQIVDLCHSVRTSADAAPSATGGQHADVASFDADCLRESWPKGMATRIIDEVNKPIPASYHRIAKAVSAEFNVPLTKKMIIDLVRRYREAIAAPAKIEADAEAEAEATSTDIPAVDRWGRRSAMTEGGSVRWYAPHPPKGTVAISWDDFEARLKAWAGNGGHVKAFGDAFGIALSTIYTWRARKIVKAGYVHLLDLLEKDAASSPAPSQSPGPEDAAPTGADAGPGSYEIQREDGLRIAELLIRNPKTSDAEIAKTLPPQGGITADASVVAKFRRDLSERQGRSLDA